MERVWSGSDITPLPKKAKKALKIIKKEGREAVWHPFWSTSFAPSVTADQFMLLAFMPFGLCLLCGFLAFGFYVAITEENLFVRRQVAKH